MCADGRPPDGQARQVDEHHLTEFELNQYLEGDLPAMEQRLADSHLAGCNTCRSELADLRAISDILRALPQVKTPRSFQLGSEFAAKPVTGLARIANVLMPMLPAMRAGTIALALALGSVTAYRVAQDQPNSSQVAEDSAAIVSTATNAPPTETTVAVRIATETSQSTQDDEQAPGAGADVDDGSDGATNSVMKTGDAPDEEPLSESADQQPVPTETESTAATSDMTAAEPVDSQSEATGGESDAFAMEDAPATQTADDREVAETSVAAAPGEDSSTLARLQEATETAVAESTDESSFAPTATVANSPTSIATATATAANSPTATATAIPPSPSSNNDGDDTWLGWAQGVLAVLLIGLGVLVVGLGRIRKRTD